jgi:hypothetical protein
MKPSISVAVPNLVAMIAVDDSVEMVNSVIDETLGFDLHEVPMGKKDF